MALTHHTNRSFTPDVAPPPPQPRRATSGKAPGTFGRQRARKSVSRSSTMEPHERSTEHAPLERLACVHRASRDRRAGRMLQTIPSAVPAPPLSPGRPAPLRPPPTKYPPRPHPPRLLRPVLFGNRPGASGSVLVSFSSSGKRAIARSQASVFLSLREGEGRGDARVRSRVARGGSAAATRRPRSRCEIAFQATAVGRRGLFHGRRRTATSPRPSLPERSGRTTGRPGARAPGHPTAPPHRTPGWGHVRPPEVATTARGGPPGKPALGRSESVGRR